jgi:hypothetical protein
MSPEVEIKLYELVENIKTTTDVRDMTIEQAYLLLKQKIKEKQIPAEIYYDPERLDPKSLWILDVSELQKPIKIVFEDEPPVADFIQGWWKIDDRQI